MVNTHKSVASATDRGAVMTKATVRAADQLGIKSSTLAKTLGVSEAQVSRFRSGKANLGYNTKEYELALLLVRVYRSLDAIVGGDNEVAHEWMRNLNTALNARPIDQIVKPQGLVHVVDYLDTRRAPL